MAKPPPATPSSDIEGVRKDRRKVGEAPDTGDSSAAAEDLARREGRGRPPNSKR